jgi:hypothetical protein
MGNCLLSMTYKYQSVSVLGPWCNKLLCSLTIDVYTDCTVSEKGDEFVELFSHDVIGGSTLLGFSSNLSSCGFTGFDG